jgi:hypothetical protein
MGSVVLLDRVYALSADVLERAMFLATSSGPILVLLCDTRPVPVYYCETPMDSPLTALETLIRHVDLLGWLSGLAPS